MGYEAFLERFLDVIVIIKMDDNVMEIERL